MSKKRPFITVENATVRLHDRVILQNSSWQIHGDEHWAILGPNGAGKSTFVRALWGGVPLRTGRILFNFAAPKTEPIELLARCHRLCFVRDPSDLMEHEERQEDPPGLASKTDEVTTVRDVIFSEFSRRTGDIHG
jgi:ABC-type multidrug transport system ATPase subunit